jgi:tyrosyl-tRNA synthetase
MNPMVPSLTGGKGNKMSSSDPNSKIDLLDSAQDVTSKIKKAFAEPGLVEGNGLLAFTRHVLFPLYGPKGFTIEREDKHGGNMHFATYEALEKSYADKLLFPLDLKIQVAKAINELLQPIRDAMSTPDMVKLIAEAYPANVVVEEPVVDEEVDEDGKAVPETAGPEATAATGTPDMTQEFYKLDLRVSVIQNVRDHPGADSLFLLDANTGSEQTTQVVTNLKSSMSADKLEAKKQVMLFNLKPTSFRGEKSLAMILGGTGGPDGTTHGLVAPLAEAPSVKAGDRLYLAGQGPVVGDIARANEKVIAKVFADLSTNDKGELLYCGKPVLAGSGPAVTVGMSGVPNAKFSAK